MKVMKMDQVPKEPYTTPLFTGPEVTRQILAPDSKDYTVNIVNFGKGVRNKFHAHDVDQVLIVTAGTGIIATEEEEKLVTVGDVIFIPAGEKHWHGATSSMSE
jgi:quercetin dioxygenase-like cupin family protein